MSSHMKTAIYGKLHRNLRGAVHLLGQRRCIDPICMKVIIVYIILGMTSVIYGGDLLM